MPLRHNGQSIGIAEVYADQTAHAANLRMTFALASIVAALLGSIGFAAPALSFFLRSRHSAKTDENIKFLANHDALTGLPNRAAFQKKMVSRLNSTLDEKKFSALHFVDIDFFKDINDRHGHDFGDQVLREIAKRLRETLREGDGIARFGGDELVIAQFGFSNAEQLGAATGRILRSFKEPFMVEGREVIVTASIGTALSPQNGENAEQLLRCADTAVYVVKSRGRNGHCFFEPQFDEVKRKRLELESIVRDAVATRKFDIHYQPFFKFKESKLKGFEALLRLRDKSGRVISPAEFIPVAEQIGLIDELGEWVIRRACETAATWPDELQIAVNLSAAQFKRHSIVDIVRNAMAGSTIAPRRLQLEITESLLMTDTDAVLEQLIQLKKMGVSIVMDDFGTGYSSLGYMLKFPFDRIKIDRSFVSELSSGNDDARTIVQTIIAMGHTMKMDVTAEGVETEVQAEMLRELKCDDAQGYLYGKPMPPSDVAALLLKNFRDEQLALQMPPSSAQIENVA